MVAILLLLLLLLLLSSLLLLLLLLSLLLLLLLIIIIAVNLHTKLSVHLRILTYLQYICCHSIYFVGQSR